MVGTAPGRPGSGGSPSLRRAEREGSMHLSVRVISWLAIAGVASVLSACGSSATAPAGSRAASGTPQSPASDSAHAGYLARGDRVCRAGNAAIAPVNARGAEIELRHRRTPGAAALLVPVLRQGLRDYRVFFVRLKRIPAPPQDGAAIVAILTGLRRVGNDLERLTAALERGEFERVKAITSERDMDHARVSALELEFGFKVCGQPPAQPTPSG
jgi:hypothetical protein